MPNCIQSTTAKLSQNESMVEVVGYFAYARMSTKNSRNNLHFVGFVGSLEYFPFPISKTALLSGEQMKLCR